MNEQNKEFIPRLKWYVFQAFLFVLFLAAIYKVLKVELSSLW
jgi:hypothetical protein